MTAPTAERGPGRPPVGPPIHVRLPADLVEWVDREAEILGQTRAAYIREILEGLRREAER